ncbi:hypothetical protein LOK49_LG04G03690 [Camellia lanceoleosa]|uniref:Uncharacterized protein n=1 Tax=Camellia lanceoleosa TaxID=1840588 RepID=A0ACC0HW44_9ERIC|nr:hypothetical protein LOK49_LG04G03690 [Camellia lanceoleosa]
MCDFEDRVFPLKECAISIALAIGLITGVPALDWCNYANAATPAVLPELSGLISGPPIQDPRALLSYALPIDNKAIREVQKPLDDITDSLKIAGLKALDSVERNVRQASRALKQGKSLIVSGLAESKKDHGIELLDNLEDGMADGFVVQTGDPEGPAEDFIDPSTGKTCTIPSEIMVNGEKVPFYRQTLEALDLYKAQTRLPFNVFGTMAMARDVSGLDNLVNPSYKIAG